MTGRCVFVGSEIDGILIEGNNHVTAFHNNFLVGMTEKRAVRYFCACLKEIISRDTESIGSLCFPGYKGRFNEDDSIAFEKRGSLREVLA
jgi:hypothetical protein